MTSGAEPLLAYDRWLPQLDDLQRDYAAAEPFPHIVLDDFVPTATAQRALEEFPPISADWIHYVHANERKFGRTERAALSPFLGGLIDELNSPAFVDFLMQLTGIDQLIPDPALEGGGLHQSKRGGFLNIHADFTVHPHRRNWRRRVNLLLYLNPAWDDAYGGHLELWDRDMRHCVRKVAPLFNRCVIFNTDADSYHGHPDPLQCPEGVTRKSIALYYFTDEVRPWVRSTDYRPRPGDGLKGLWIYLDKMTLRQYDRVKRTFGLSDRFASDFLRFFTRSERR
jgi:hypothetical protein